MATYETRTLSPGIAPAEIALINSTDNYSGNTKLGLMQYQHGTTYNGGNAPTVTLVGGGGTLDSVDFTSFIPYQVSDGTWRLKFNITVSLSVISRSGVTLGVNGVTFKTIPTSALGQAVSADCGTLASLGRSGAQSNSSNLSTEFSTVVCGGARFSGDVALNSKPTWAY
jgi:hypothetical protein